MTDFLFWRSVRTGKMKKYFNVLILLVIFSSSLFSQKISEMYAVGEGELLKNEFIRDKIRDANGNVCAGLKIISDLGGLSYTSNNGIVKVDEKPGQSLLFLQGEERVVTVFKTGFVPLKIILSEHNIFLKSGQVWQIKISGEKTSAVIPVNIIVDRREAAIFLDGMNKGAGPTFQLTPGKHKLKIELQGFKTVSETIEVSASNNLFDYSMEMIEQVPVKITSEPAGADIKIDNFDRGRTDKVLFLFPGKYNIKILKSGYAEISDEIFVNGERENKFNYSLVKNSGILRITGAPEGATIFVNNSIVQKNKIELPPGSHLVEIKAPGFKVYKEIIEVSRGKQITRNVALEEKTGRLNISVKPLDAAVTLSSQGRTIEQWTGYKTFDKLRTGRYLISASLTGMKGINKEIEIKEGETLTEELELNQEIKNVIFHDDDIYDEKKEENKTSGQSLLVLNPKTGKFEKVEMEINAEKEFNEFNKFMLSGDLKRAFEKGWKIFSAKPYFNKHKFYDKLGLAIRSRYIDTKDQNERKKYKKMILDVYQAGMKFDIKNKSDYEKWIAIVEKNW